MSDFEEIKSPKGIRFECSGCANCCMEWPVPLTHQDTERIRIFNPSAAVKRLNSSRPNLLSFTHTLEKRADGSCTFLDSNARCSLHAERGIEAKPSMCHLFPYSFMVTPDAVSVYLSFASSAVLFNQGKLLSEQQELLKSQYRVFCSLFKPQKTLWNTLQIIDGEPIDYESFSELNKKILQLVEGEDAQDEINHPANLHIKLEKVCAEVISLIPSNVPLEREPKLEAKPEIVDQLFLKNLDALYFPERIFQEENYDFKAKALLSEIILAPNAVSLGEGKSAVQFADLQQASKPSKDIENLIDRFLYVKLFAKMYFGPGFHHLSLLSGLNHLRILSILLRLKFKQYAVLTDKEISFETAIEYVRTLERRLTQLDISRESQAVLEVILSSPSRQERMNS